MRLSVTIIARDEEDRIVGAVQGASWAEEVLVLDSGSSDRTVARAATAGARVVVEPWRGFGAQKNRAAELARHHWILSLDADERPDELLIGACLRLADDPGAVAFRLRRRNWFGDRPIRRWPWSWDRTVRLYDRHRARFNDRVVHESVHADGRIADLDGVLEHHCYRDWPDYRRRRRRYAMLGAEEAAARGRPPRAGDLTVRPAATFLRHWLGRGYLLGGVLGWRLSMAAASGTRLKYRILADGARDDRTSSTTK
jgi:glycosyltransferase involved in cell wall biosynthesis